MFQGANNNHDDDEDGAGDRPSSVASMVGVMVVTVVVVMVVMVVMVVTMVTFVVTHHRLHRTHLTNNVAYSRTFHVPLSRGHRRHQEPERMHAASHILHHAGRN
jgi:hypothetical protein